MSDDRKLAEALDRIAKLEAAIAVVRENYDKCRLAEPGNVPRTRRGGEYIQVPHEECIEAIRVALAALEAEKDE